MKEGQYTINAMYVGAEKLRVLPSEEDKILRALSGQFYNDKCMHVHYNTKLNSLFNESLRNKHVISWFFIHAEAIFTNQKELTHLVFADGVFIPPRYLDRFVRGAEAFTEHDQEIDTRPVYQMWTPKGEDRIGAYYLGRMLMPT